MAGYSFRFGEEFSDEIGLRVEGTPDLGTAQRDGELISIPGKDGDEYIDYGRYKNVEFSLNVAVVQKGIKTVRDLIDDIINSYAYLYGYQYFEDSDHFNLSTEAVLTNFGEFKRELRRLGKATLKFSRKPFWYDVTGLQFTDVSLAPETPTKVLDNPFKLTAKPIFIFTPASGAPSFFTIRIATGDTITDYNYTTVNSLPLTVDCEKETAKIGSAKFDFSIPTGFEPGETTISIVSGKSNLSSVQLAPRWRCL